MSQHSPHLRVKLLDLPDRRAGRAIQHRGPTADPFSVTLTTMSRAFLPVNRPTLTAVMAKPPLWSVPGRMVRGPGLRQTRSHPSVSLPDTAAASAQSRRVAHPDGDHFIAAVAVEVGEQGRLQRLLDAREHLGSRCRPRGALRTRRRRLPSAVDFERPVPIVVDGQRWVQRAIRGGACPARRRGRRRWRGHGGETVGRGFIATPLAGRGFDNEAAKAAAGSRRQHHAIALIRMPGEYEEAIRLTQQPSCHGRRPDDAQPALTLPSRDTNRTALRIVTADPIAQENLYAPVAVHVRGADHDLTDALREHAPIPRRQHDCPPLLIAISVLVADDLRPAVAVQVRRAVRQELNLSFQIVVAHPRLEGMVPAQHELAVLPIDDRDLVVGADDEDRGLSSRTMGQIPKWPPQLRVRLPHATRLISLPVRMSKAQTHIWDSIRISLWPSSLTSPTASCGK